MTKSEKFNYEEAKQYVRSVAGFWLVGFVNCWLVYDHKQSPPKALATIAHDAGRVPKTHLEVLIAELLVKKVLRR